MHAFGMSERYLILAEYPLRVNPLKLAFSGRAFIKNYRWQPEQGTRFQVFDRETGALRGTYETEAFFAFHHVNAFERGDELVIDLVAFEDTTIIDSLYLDEHGPVAALPPSELRRYTIGLDSGLGAPRAAGRGHGRAAADRLPAPQHARLPLRVLQRDAASGELARPARQGRRRAGRGGLLGRGRLLSRASAIFVRAPGDEARGRRAASSRSCSTRAPGARSCSCSTRARSASWPGPRRRTTSRSASTGSTCDERPDLLASDSERDAAAERLRDAAGEGRLDPGGARAAARPGARRPYPGRARRRGGRPAGAARASEAAGPRQAAGAAAFLSTSLLLVAIWALSGMGYFWPAWPILGWGVFLVVSRPRRLPAGSPPHASGRAPTPELRVRRRWRG